MLKGIFRNVLIISTILLFFRNNDLKSQIIYFSEGFEGEWVGTPPAPIGWLQKQGNPGTGNGYFSVNFQKATYTNGLWSPMGNGIVPPGAFEGNSVAYYYDYDAISGQTDTLITPLINLSGASNVKISFRYFYASGGAILRLLASNNGGITWTNISGNITATGANWTLRTYNIPSSFWVTNARFALVAVAAFSNNDLWIDDFKVYSDIPMSVQSISVFQQDNPIIPGFNNQKVLSYNIFTEGNTSPLVLTNSFFTTTGSQNISTNFTNAKIYYTGNSNTFSTSNLVGSLNTNPNTTFNISSNITLAPGNNYFWLVFDASQNAQIGNQVDVSLDSLIISTVKYYPLNPNPTGVQFIESPLAGIYEVGSGKYFNTLTEAINTINLYGLNAPVTFILTDSIYSNETLPIIINELFGSSANNVLTIKSTHGRRSIISGNSSSSIIRIRGADFIVIDSLEITNTSLANNTAVVWIESLGLNKGATNITIKNSFLSCSNNTTNSNTFGIYCGGNFISNVGVGADNDKLVFRNNIIKCCNYGIFISAPSGNTNDSITIEKNKFGDELAEKTITFRAIQLNRINQFTIKENQIYNIVNSDGVSLHAISCNYVNNGIIDRNFISGIIHTSNNSRCGQAIFIGENSTGNLIISNNMISNLSGHGNALITNNVWGIMLMGGSNYKIYNNSINLFGNILSTTFSDYHGCIYLNSGLSGLDIRNNIFSMKLIPGNTLTGKVFGIYSLSNSNAFLHITNNNYYTANNYSNVGYLGTIRRDTTEWKTATGKDEIIFNTDPLFISETDLHCRSYMMNQRAVPLSEVQYDYDGDVRDVLYPDIGADEFSQIQQDIAIIDILSPKSGCSLSSAESITIKVKNMLPIDSKDTIPLLFSYNNGLSYIRDTLYQSIPPLSIVNFTFTQKANFSNVGTYYCIAACAVSEDQIKENDTLKKTIVSFNTYTSLNEDFENFVIGNSNILEPGELADDWERYSSSGNFHWIVNKGSTPTPETGPSRDNTLKTNEGKYVYTEASSPALPGDIAILQSPCLNIQNFRNPVFKFSYHMYGINIDTLFVDALIDGNWQNIFYLKGQWQTSSYDEWKDTIIDLNLYKTLSKIRFRVKRGTGEKGDIAIDDVAIQEYYPDLKLVEIQSPKSGCSLSTKEPLTVKIFNHSIKTLNDTVFLHHKINTRAWQTDTILLNLNANSYFIYTFSDSLDLSLPKQHSIFCRLDYNHDSDTTNNFLYIEVRNFETVSIFPHLNDFETNAYEWLPGGHNCSWKLGIPHKQYINSAFSGKKCWVTDTAFTYNQNEISYVESHCFNLSNVTSPEIRFNYNCVLNHPYAVALLYSIDNGVTWNLLGNVGEGMNWYNNSNATFLSQNWNISSGWSGNSLGWKIAKYSAPQLAGKNNVRFRFVFASDNNILTEGFAFDNFLVSEKIPEDVGITEIITPPLSICGNITDTIKIKIKNYGTTAISNIPIQINIINPNNNTISFLDTIGVIILPDDYFELKKNINTTLPGHYFITATTNLQSDINTFNNSLTNNFYIPHVDTVLYFENFDDEHEMHYLLKSPNVYFDYSQPYPNKSLIMKIDSLHKTSSFVTTRITGISNNTRLIFSYMAVVDSIGFPVYYFKTTDSLIISVSENCGNTFNNVFVVDSSTATNQNSFTRINIPLNAYAGKDIIVKFLFKTNLTNSKLIQIDSLILIDDLPPVIDFQQDTFYVCENLLPLKIQQPYILGNKYYWYKDSLSAPVISRQTELQITTEGWYFLKVSNILETLSIDSFYVKILPIPQINLFDTYSICYGESAIIDAGINNGSYVWKRVLTGDTISRNRVFVHNDSGNYCVVVFDENNCSNSDTFQIIVKSLPYVELGPNRFLCGGDSIVLSISPNLSVNWSNGSTNNNLTIYAIDDTISVVVYDSLSGCYNYDTLIVKSNKIPWVYIYGDSVSFCRGDSIILKCNHSRDYGHSLMWQKVDLLPVILSFSDSIIINSGGIYLTRIDDLCGNSVSDTIVVRENELPQINLSSYNTSLCVNDSLSISVGNFSEYNWSDENLIGSTVIISGRNYGVGTHEFYLTVTDANNCKNSDTLKISFWDIPSVNLGNDTSVCSNNSLLLDAGEHVSYTWNYSVFSGRYALMNNSNFAVGEHIVSVTVSDINNCKNSDSIKVVFLPLPSVNLGNDTVLCSYENLVLETGIWQIYHWSESFLSGPNPIVNYEMLGEGEHLISVTVTDLNNCANSDTIKLTYKGKLITNLESNIYICLGDTAILSPGNFSNYLWNNLSSDSILLVSQPGNYYVTVSDGRCFAVDSSEVIVFESTLDISDSIIITTRPDTVILKPESSGYFVYYQWYHNGIPISNSNILQCSSYGWYVIQAIDTCGNIFKDSVLVDLPTKNLIIDGGFYCNIYPNPVFDKLTIEFDSRISGEILIKDLLGRELKKQQLIEKTKGEINFEDFGKGVYFVIIVRNGVEAVIKKVIKE